MVSVKAVLPFVVSDFVNAGLVTAGPVKNVVFAASISPIMALKSGRSASVWLAPDNRHTQERCLLFKLHLCLFLQKAITLSFSMGPAGCESAQASRPDQRTSSALMRFCGLVTMARSTNGSARRGTVAPPRWSTGE